MGDGKPRRCTCNDECIADLSMPSSCWCRYVSAAAVVAAASAGMDGATIITEDAAFTDGAVSSVMVQ